MNYETIEISPLCPFCVQNRGILETPQKLNAINSKENRSCVAFNKFKATGRNTACYQQGLTISFSTYCFCGLFDKFRWFTNTEMYCMHC